MGVGLNSALARISPGGACVLFCFFLYLSCTFVVHTLICTYGHDNLAFKLRSVLDETWR